MFAPPVMQRLTGDRVHLSHGPIDVVARAWGPAEEVRAAYAAVWDRFPHILPELCDELSSLRQPIDQRPLVNGPVARRMVAACRPFAETFVTPMAAVAGAVADDLLAGMRAAASLTRAFVNDGGDIAVYMAPGHGLEVGIAGEFSRGDIPILNGKLRLDHHMGVGGIATSGARGRSFSLGIADTVTVLARDAATADVAATLIANAVDVASPAVVRRPARELDPDSDLGTSLVTVAVGSLGPQDIAAALDQGLQHAQMYLKRGLITGAALMLAGEVRTCGGPMFAPPGTPNADSTAATPPATTARSDAAPMTDPAPT